MARITKTQRNEVATLHKAGHTRNHIAKTVGISAGSVTKICQELGLNFNRDHTRAAVAAKQADDKHRRQQLKTHLLEDAHKLREQLWTPTQLVNFGGKDNTLNSTTISEPLFVDKKNIMTAIGTAIDRYIRLDAIDNNNGQADAESMLHQLATQLGLPDDQP
ncbi:hypothetical protein [Acaricomes phytoseiuli]|uniref:hypothetical protein n=1 Tax=Acaricomes phytoseiuli TaxID=291968 RepID=UPI00036106F4|nr:hypothetical protein [Acaricomes phytoseiuli]